MLMSTEVAMSVMSKMRQSVFVVRRFALALSFLVFMALGAAPLSGAQSQPQQPQQPDQATPDSGGPGADSGVIALPKKKDTTEDVPPSAPAEPKVKNPEGMSNYSLRIEVPEVTVDVGVLLEKTGQFVPGLKPGNEGQPLRIQDEKHKPLKYDIIAREGFRARQEVELGAEDGAGQCSSQTL